MPIQLKYITVSELENYVVSQEYKWQSFFPISIPRAISHAQNPRSKGDDTALILAFDEEKLVGYLGAIPEYIYVENLQHTIGWYSCMWVLPEYRRAGVAKLLLEEGSLKYDGKVCITNYIERSKAAFLKNNQFVEVEVLQGIRAYLKLDLEQIIPRKIAALNWFKPIFWFTDTLGNLVLSLLFQLKVKKTAGNYSFSSIDTFGEEYSSFIRENMKDSLFKRGVDEFNWLLNFPWITSVKPKESNLKKYYFSQYNRDFKQWAIKINRKDNKLVGIVILTRHKRELKTPYLLCEKEVLPDLYSFIYELMLGSKIRTLVTHHADFAEEVRKHRSSFLHLRSSHYGFMATPQVVDLVNGKFGQFFDGDGDGMFT